MFERFILKSRRYFKTSCLRQRTRVAVCATHSELVDEGGDVEPKRWLLTLDGAFEQQHVGLHQHPVHHDPLGEDASSVLQQAPGKGGTRDMKTHNRRSIVSVW